MDIYYKEKSGETKQTIELKSLLTPENWEKVKHKICSLRNEIVDSTRILVVTGVEIQDAISIAKNIYKDYINKNIDTRQITLLFAKILNHLN